jgi:hypothetical protein
LLQAYVAFYQEVAIHEAQSVDLDGLISTYEHNRDHFQKMVASLIPILSMLTSDPLQELLSPDFEPGHERLVTDMSKIIRGNKVVYIGLDSLADSTVGSAIGSIMLADLAAVAGDRYNYGIDTLTPVNLFIDEAAEVLNQPAIQLMNKGGGADFRVTIATQTFADFASRLGDENKARQVLANTNNKIALRVLDSETQKYIAEGMPQTKVRSMALRYGHNVDTHIHDEYSASYQEQILEEEADLFPAAMLGELPPLHFIARLSGGRRYEPEPAPRGNPVSGAGRLRLQPLFRRRLCGETGQERCARRHGSQRFLKRGTERITGLPCPIKRRSLSFRSRRLSFVGSSIVSLPAIVDDGADFLAKARLTGKLSHFLQGAHRVGRVSHFG